SWNCEYECLAYRVSYSYCSCPFRYQQFCIPWKYLYIVLYHRKNGNIELPGTDVPRLGMLSLGEDEVIGGSELSAMINEAKENKLELIIAISDRETAVTYYKVRRIILPKSEYEYYEIDWMQP
ncbi:MAG: hypothetical protein M1124_00935, partial [Candidatus Marsarchaeota archaeon]|nr:hypothetical protein [Candidatus Marsarchaeota archaeon]